MAKVGHSTFKRIPYDQDAVDLKNHIPYRWVVADESERLALITDPVVDKWNLCLQLDNNSAYTLNPADTWVQVNYVMKAKMSETYHSTNIAILNNGLRVDKTVSSGFYWAWCEAPITGKTFWEVKYSVPGAFDFVLWSGGMGTPLNTSSGAPAVQHPNGYGIYFTGPAYEAGVYTGRLFTVPPAGSTIGIAVDLPGKRASFIHNNAEFAYVNLPTVDQMYFAVSLYTDSVLDMNFGQADFINNVPAGYTAGLEI